MQAFLIRKGHCPTHKKYMMLSNLYVFILWRLNFQLVNNETYFMSFILDWISDMYLVKVFVI